jgi:hypothetical protein
MACPFGAVSDRSYGTVLEASMSKIANFSSFADTIHEKSLSLEDLYRIR